MGKQLIFPFHNFSTKDSESDIENLPLVSAINVSEEEQKYIDLLQIAPEHA